MPYVRKKRRFNRSVKLKALALLLSLLAVAAVLVSLYAQQQRVIAENAASAATFTPAPVGIVPTDEPGTRPAASQVVSTLADPSKPLSMAVIGDSTGNGENEWVYLTAQQLAETYGRTITVHNWDAETHTYTSATPVGQGEGATVDIWNGSASGKNEQYSLEHFDAIVPAPVDVAFINHGHNSGADQIIGGIDSIIDQLPDDAAVTVIAQNPRTLTDVERQESIVGSIRETWADTNVGVIDVHAAYTEFGDIDALLNDDGFHPNDAGERLWAETVIEALSI